MRKRRLIASLLCAGIIFSFAGCSVKNKNKSEKEPKRTSEITTSKDAPTAEDTSTTENARENARSANNRFDSEPQVQFEITLERTAPPSVTPHPTLTPLPLITPREASYFGEFVPYVISDVIKEYVGEEEVQDYYRFCEAVLAEEETFLCNSFEGYSSAYYILAMSFFPYGYDVVAPPEYYDFKDGVATIHYLETKEWRQDHYDELKTGVEEVISQAFQEDYNDFEKMISLYIYMMDSFEYDYELRHNIDGYRGVYLPLMKKTGVCNEFASFYAYLLLQVGVEADFATGLMTDEADGHRWNIVRLNGEYYYMDPTWGIGSKDLAYFLMDTEQRTMNNTIFTDISITDAPAFEEDQLPITSRKYSELWESLSFEVDYDHDVIRYSMLLSDGTLVEKEFHY